jgi:hypothetical protein
MIEIEYHKLRAAQLIREADEQRLAREVVRARRAARRAQSAGHAAPGAEPHTGRPGRRRLPRTA